MVSSSRQERVKSRWANEIDLQVNCDQVAKVVILIVISIPIPIPILVVKQKRTTAFRCLAQEN